MFITDEEFLTLDATKLNAILQKVVLKATEEALQALPVVIGTLISQTGTLKQLAMQFYENNKDLSEHKEIVAKLIEEEEAKNPGVKFDKILESVAPKARSIVNTLRTTTVENKPIQIDKLANGVL